MHVCRPPVPVGQHFKGKSAEVRRIFKAVQAAVKKLGPVEVDSTRTRIAFAVETIFLELSPQQKALRGCLMLARRARHLTIERAISPSPGRHYHFFRLTEPGQVDARFRRLLAEAYRVVGRREHLRKPLRKQRVLAAAYAQSPPALPARQPRQPAGGTPIHASRVTAGLKPGPTKTQRPSTSLRTRGSPRRQVRPKRPLWRCGKCGRRFVTRNLWHSCARISVESHFKGKDPKLRRTFRALVAALRKNGPLFINANKTRITFQARMRFAGVQVQKDGLRCGLTLTRRVRDARFFQVVSFGPRSFGYTFRLSDPKQVDARLRRYLAEAYKVGQQEHLQKT